jgi:hypothetical protein
LHNGSFGSGNHTTGGFEIPDKIDAGSIPDIAFSGGFFTERFDRIPVLLTVKFILYTNGTMADIPVDSFEPPCVRRATEDLCSDLVKITGVEPCLKQYLPTVEEGAYILIGSLENERLNPPEENLVRIAVERGGCIPAPCRTYGGKPFCLG